MCKKTLSYILLFLLLVASPAFSGESTQGQTMEQIPLTDFGIDFTKPSKESQTLNSDLMSSNSSSSKMSKSSENSTQPQSQLSQLLNSQLQDLMMLDNTLAMLETSLDDSLNSSKSSLSKLEESKRLIEELKSNNQKLQEALFSNKDDTAHITMLFAESQLEIDKLRDHIGGLESKVKSLKNQRWIFGGIGVSIGIAGGVGLMYLLMR